MPINNKTRNVQGDKTAYVGPESTLQDNIWLRHDQNRDLPYLDIFKSMAFLTKYKILM